MEVREHSRTQGMKKPGPEEARHTCVGTFCGWAVKAGGRRRAGAQRLHGLPLSKRTPNGCCPMEGEPCWPPSGQIDGGRGSGLEAERNWKARLMLARAAVRRLEDRAGEVGPLGQPRLPRCSRDPLEGRCCPAKPCSALAPPKPRTPASRSPGRGGRGASGGRFRLSLHRRRGRWGRGGR